MKTYEAMFLFDSSFASDASKVEQEVGRLMERAGAEVVMSNKWDERKLAYEIKGRKRGCYVLTFFRAESDKITGIERDVQLSETVLRVLIVRADHMTEDDMKKAYPTRGAASESRTDGHAGSRGRTERAPAAAAPDTAAAKTAPAEAGAEPATAVAEAPVEAAAPAEPAEATAPVEPAAAESDEKPVEPQ